MSLRVLISLPKSAEQHQVAPRGSRKATQTDFRILREHTHLETGSWEPFHSTEHPTETVVSDSEAPRKMTGVSLKL